MDYRRRLLCTGSRVRIFDLLCGGVTMEEEQKEKKDGAIAVDLRKLYRFEPGELQLDIAHSSYSNLAYVQVAHRDVCIDFLEMPGVRRDGRARINGTRVYMSHAAAQKLAEALS